MLELILVPIAVSGDIFLVSPPGRVEVVGHDDVGVIFVVVEHLVPGLGVSVEGIVEDEFEVRSLVLHACMNATVVTSEEGEVG
jgi:hypothetical protein